MTSALTQHLAAPDESTPDLVWLLVRPAIITELIKEGYTENDAPVIAMTCGIPEITMRAAFRLKAGEEK